MYKKTVFLVIILLLLTGCQPLSGPYNISFENDNWAACKEVCLGLHDNMRCSYYFYEWAETNDKGNCTCEVNTCWMNNTSFGLEVVTLG